MCKTLNLHFLSQPLLLLVFFFNSNFRVNKQTVPSLQ